MGSFREQMDGFPLWQISVISLIRFAEPITFTSLFPYVYFMIRDFHVTKDPSQISRFTGSLAASFAFAQFLCCIQWARLSDRVGRKPVLLAGCLSSSVFMLMFGFAKSFPVALLARTLAGASNGNAAVLQTVVGELVTERRHQAVAFATLPLFWNVGIVVGPMIGGSKYLTRPKPTPPHTSTLTSSYDAFLNDHPYALSNVVVALLLLCSVLVGFLFLEETQPRARKRYDYGLAAGDKLRRVLGFTIPARPWETVAKSKSWGASEALMVSDEAVQCDDESTPLARGAVPRYTGSSNEADIDNPGEFSSRRSSLGAIRRYSNAASLDLTVSRSNPASEAEPTTILAALRNRDIFTYKVIWTLLGYFYIAFHTLIHTEFVPVFLAGDYQPGELHFPWKVKGGLGWKTQEIATLFSSVGLVGCFVIIIVYPILDRHVRTIVGFRAASCVFPIAYSAVPFYVFTTTGYNPDFPPWLSKVALYFNSALAVFASSIAFPQITVLLYRATKPRYRALVNATSLSVNSFARFVAPVTWGALMSYFDERALGEVSWLFLGVLAVFGTVLAFNLDEYSENEEA